MARYDLYASVRRCFDRLELLDCNNIAGYLDAAGLILRVNNYTLP